MRLVHTSDLHLAGNRPLEEDVAMAALVAATAVALGAEVLAIAGDLFDHNRVARERARALVAPLLEPGMPVVVLPGNHDPLTAGSVYRHLDDLANLHVLGLHGRTFGFGGAWTVTGRPHRDYGSFPPLDLAGTDDEDGDADAGLGGRGQAGPDAASDARGNAGVRAAGSGIAEPSERIVLAHGHYDLRDEAGALHRPGWLITAADLDAIEARYVGLGHWDRAYTVREAGPPTFYSGSPWLAGSVNVVDLEPGALAKVSRQPLVARDRPSRG